MNLVPYGIEDSLCCRPEDNKVGLLRPEEKYGGLSEIMMFEKDTGKVMEILTNCQEVEVQEFVKESRMNLIQQVILEFSEEAVKYLLKEQTMPNPNEFSYDFDMNDPISSCLKQTDYKQTAVELFLDYILSQKRSFFIHKMILANLKDISECDKLKNFEKFLEDINESDEFDTQSTKFGWLLQKGEH